MSWYCDNCGERLKGRICSNRWREAGMLVRCSDTPTTAERFPRLDGLLFFDETEDNQGAPRFELMKQRERGNGDAPNN